MKPKLMAYCVAMDENGTLWVATWDRHCGTRVVWERMPLVGCAMMTRPPLNALLVGRVLRPDFAVDAYIMTSSQVESLETVS